VKEAIFGRNQRLSKEVREGREKAFGWMDSTVKAASREERIKQSQREFEEEQGLEDQRAGLRFLKERSQYQFYRALRHVFKENAATPQEMDYIDRQGKEMERFTFPESLKDPEAPEELPEVIITNVNFTPPNSKNSS